MNRRDLFRGFALGAAGLMVPRTARGYSFAGGWAMPKAYVEYASGEVVAAKLVDTAVGPRWHARRVGLCSRLESDTIVHVSTPGGEWWADGSRLWRGGPALVAFDVYTDRCHNAHEEAAKFMRGE